MSRGEAGEVHLSAVGQEAIAAVRQELAIAAVRRRDQVIAAVRQEQLIAAVRQGPNLPRGDSR